MEEKMKKIKLIAISLVCLMLLGITVATVSAAEVTYKPVVDGGKLYGIPAETTVAGLGNAYYKTIIEVYKPGVSYTASSTEKIGTGYTVRLNGVSYTAVVLGDVNGDGAVAAVDYLMVKRAVLGTLENGLEGVYLEAAGVEAGDTIKAVNYLAVKRAVLGTYNINEDYTCDPYDPAAGEGGWTDGWV